MIIVVALGTGLFTLRTAGSWLVVQDPLQPARAVVVLAGHLPFRAMEAASIFKRGGVDEVWLTKGAVYGEDLAIEKLGIDQPPEYVYSEKVLERLGVPDNAIRVLQDATIDTAEEVRVVAAELKAVGGQSVIIVTSKSHTRRVKVIWRTLVGRHPQAIIRYTPNDPFEPTRWWQNTQDAMAVSREWFGILNVLAGFPVKSSR